MKLPIVALSFTLATTLLICSKPSAHAEIRVEDDGVHIRMLLDGIDQVEIAGRTVADEESVVVPFSELGAGLNELPITGKGLDGVVAHVDVPPSKVLDLQCGDEKRRASIEIVGDDGRQMIPKWEKHGCEVVGGKVVVPIALPDGFTVEVEGGELTDGTLRIDLRPSLWATPVPTDGLPRARPKQPSEHAISIKSASGKTWTGKLTIEDQSDTLGSVLAKLPEAGQGMPEPGTLAAIRVGDYWSFEGDRKTLGQIDLWVHAIERGEPVELQNCNFQELGLGNAVHSLKIIGIPQTYVAVDRQGNELGRKDFAPKGCPTSATIEPGQTELEVFVSSQLVRDWVIELRSKK